MEPRWWFYSRVVQKWLPVEPFRGLTMEQTIYQMQQLRFEMKEITA